MNLDELNDWLEKGSTRRLLLFTILKNRIYFHLINLFLIKGEADG